MYKNAKKVLAQVAMKSAVDYINDGNLNLSANIKQVSYQNSVSKIRSSNASDFSKAVALAQLQKATGRNRKGKLINK